MGLFDGVKDAFSAPALERSVLDAERETPIDRWFGWSVVDDKVPEQQGMPHMKMYILSVMFAFVIAHTHAHTHITLDSSC